MAQKDIGVLPEYRGHLVRDGFKSYDQFDACSHSFCNAHILRELKFLSEEENLKWAAELATFLKKTLKQVHDGRKSKAFRERTIADYRAILREGFSECGFKHEWKGRPPDGFKNDYDRGKRFKVPIFKRRKLSKAMNLWCVFATIWNRFCRSPSVRACPLQTTRPSVICECSK
ncbi:MAG: transposase [Bdellovibrionales bacterium]|nr:transposase [Bdellovibrionales bacterium]